MPDSVLRLPSLDAVLVLALDTATPFVVVGVVEVGEPAESGWHDLGSSRAERSVASGNRHAESLGQLIPEVLAEADIGMDEVSAIVVGIGPGPFTGLRVGVMTAAALADALGAPVHGVCSHDAIAAMHKSLADRAPHGTAVLDEDFVVVTDARRRECYWARYDASGARISGPHVQRPAEVVARSDWRPGGPAIGNPAFSEALGTEIVPARPVPIGLVLAVDSSTPGRSAGPLEPLYLRRPDANPPAPRKPVTPQ